MPAAACPECNGTGWIIVEREELSGAERCECVRSQRAERAMTAAGIPPLYANAGFDNFVRDDKVFLNRELTTVYRKVQAFADTYPFSKKAGLLLMGSPGTGKTHLAVAALRAILAKGFEGLFFDYQNLLDRIRSGYDQTSNSSDKEAYSVALDKEVLLLDDLGAHRVTDWVMDTVTSIITSRCNNKKTLIATTNLIDGDAGFVTYEKHPVTGIVDHATTLRERIGERARSRLFEMCDVIRMPAIEDYRVRKKGF